MGKLKSEREKKLQRKLIPLNIVVCILALVAALTLFLTPLVKVDVGAILRDEGVMSFVDEKIDEIVSDTVEGTEQEDIDYKPVVASLVKGILGKAEGEVTISGIGAMRVLTASGDKTEKVMEELLFGDDALATRLINSVVDGVAEIFNTDEGKTLLEEAVISSLTKGIIKSVDNETVTEKMTKENVKELVSIFRELGEDENVPEGKVDTVAGKLIDKIDEMLGEDINIAEEDKENFINEMQTLYDDTKGYLTDGEKVSVESIMCVTISKNVDLSQFDIGDLFDNFFGDSEEEGGEKENSVHINTVEVEISGDGETEGGEVGGGTQEGGATESTNKVVTNYDDLLLEIGYDEAQKDELKEKMRTSLNDALNDMVREQGIDDYMGYYGYITFVALVFMLPWIILFLFSFFHILAKNKRFTMWYVKLFGWIPAMLWLVLKLFPVIAPKVSALSDLWNGENSSIVKAAFSSVSTFTWISGLCYVLLWLVSIFWAFPIKHKIRKERKNPEVTDADEYEE